VQMIKEFVSTGELNTGSGFFANEESGVGFKVRQEKLKLGKIAVLDGEGNQVVDKEGNPLYRPYSAIDPISYIMTGGNLESGNARLINAIGEIGFMIYADPLTKVNKVVKAKNAILKSEAYQKGRASAEDLKKLTVLESQIAASADDTVKALEDLGLVERAVNAGVNFYSDLLGFVFDNPFFYKISNSSCGNIYMSYPKNIC